MAVFTIFITTPTLNPPVSDDGTTWRYYATASAIMLNSQNTPVSPWGMEEPWAGYITLTATDAVTASDTLNSIRTKIMAQVRPNFPNVQPLDVLRVIWLDSGGLLNL